MLKKQQISFTLPYDNRANKKEAINNKKDNQKLKHGGKHWDHQLYNKDT